MNYYFEDFTEYNYKKLLDKISHKTISYEQIEFCKNFTLWRHDIDLSVHRAYALAKIEKQMGVKATYFLQTGSIFYNIFDEEIQELVFKIKDLGHELGLHFSPSQYIYIYI